MREPYLANPAYWADADLLAWTLREPGTAAAAQAYAQAHLGGPRTPRRQT